MNFLIALVSLFVSHAHAEIPDFSSHRTFSNAKPIVYDLFRSNPHTLYCGCSYKNKAIDLTGCGYKKNTIPDRADRVEIEHVVPAAVLGRSFSEWTRGSIRCVDSHGKSFRGRECARTHPQFSEMESDLNNLWPVVGEVNALRGNLPMSEHLRGKGQFGKCRVKIETDKFEPTGFSKGRVARTYLYMANQYPGRFKLKKKEMALFQKWDQDHPADQFECERAKAILSIQKTPNPIMSARCLAQFGDSLN